MTTFHSVRQKIAFGAASLGMLVGAIPALAAPITSDLYVGVTSSDVVTLQQFLMEDPSLYPEGLVTGYFGALTERAVVRFQARWGISTVGRVGPITRAKINALMASGSVQGDVNAPIMSRTAVATTSNSATISWTTSEPARSKVMYGTVYPFLYATAPSVSTPGVDVASNITLYGLSPNTTYFYVRESVDIPGNVMWTAAKTFRTNP